MVWGEPELTILVQLNVFVLTSNTMVMDNFDDCEVFCQVVGHLAWPVLWLTLLNLVVHHISSNQDHLFILACLLSQLLVFDFVKYSDFCLPSRSVSVANIV